MDENWKSTRWRCTDIYGIRDGVAIWLELKCIRQNSINLSPLQISWNYNNFCNGGINYYIVRDARSKVLKLYSGNKGREIKEQGFKCPCSLQLEPPTDWQKLGDYLFCDLPHCVAWPWSVDLRQRVTLTRSAIFGKTKPSHKGGGGGGNI